MTTPDELVFPPFRLDLANEQLWEGDRLVPLRPKAFAVLRHLAERPGTLVTKADIIAAVWQGTSVVEAALKVRIRELREALGDDSETPRFIATVARRGYRFVAPLVESYETPPPTMLATAAAPLLVGREEELARLEGALARARAGERQIVYVTGDAGAGKTTLVNAFLARVAGANGCWIGAGCCVEHYGSGEAYLPILEALSRLCRGAGHERLPALLRRYAPTWLVQLPWLLGPNERETLLREVQGVAQERMLREMADALEALSADTLLVLALEDLHWSDYSTLDLLALLTRRSGAARLLVVATYRPVDAILRDHPVKQLKQDLAVHGLCEELGLESFSRGEVATYLGRRFPPAPAPAAIVDAVFQRTDGHPLFLAAVADDLATENVVTSHDGAWRWHDAAVRDVGVPATIRQLIERQIERLAPEDRRLLEVASAIGQTFASAAVAAALAEDVSSCEERCERLARRGQLLQTLEVGTWPDGTLTGHYGFAHALYRRVLHDALPAGRRSRLHATLGQLLERVYGDRASEIAAELAVHCEEGRDFRRAVHYLQQAAAKAMQRKATREAVDLLTRAAHLLAELPEDAERLQRELGIQMTLGPALMATRGYAAPEVERAFTRARALCQAMGDPTPLFPVLWGIWGFHVVRGEMGPARALAEQCFALARDAGDPDLLVEAHHALWVTRFFCGELADALAHVEQGLALYRPEHRAHALAYGQDPAVAAHAYGGLICWFIGRPADSERHVAESLRLGKEVGHPFSLGFALNFAAWVSYCRGDLDLARRYARELTTLATEQGFPFWHAGALHFAAWVMVAEGDTAAGLAQLRAGLDAWQATGAGLGLPSHLGRTVEAHLLAGQRPEATATLARAFTALEQTGQRYYEPELHRLRGAMLLDDADEAAAEPDLVRAHDVATRQGSIWLVSRTAVSLAELRRRQGRSDEARRIVDETCRLVGDDLGAVDAVALRVLRDELGTPSAR